MWIWPRALPLAEIFGPGWDGDEVRTRFLGLAGQWHARRPVSSVSPPPGGGPLPGQWMWHPPARRIYDCHTYEDGDDWLEVAIRLERIDLFPNHCRLDASLTIACTCDAGHGGHTIVETSWRTGGAAAALDALTVILRYTDQWIANSRRPAAWRHHAGLD